MDFLSVFARVVEGEVQLWIVKVLPLFPSV
jgi:hypothetical protein